MPDTTKSRILRKAREIFAKYGYKKTGVYDIGHACGMTKSSLYHHFSNKEEIFAEVVKSESGILLKRLVKLLEDIEDPAEKLKLFILKRFELMRECLNLYKISMEKGLEMLPLAEKSRQEFFRQEERMLSGILKDGMKKGVFKKGEVNSISKSLIYAFKGIEEVLILNQDIKSISRVMNSLLDIFYNGLLVMPR